MIIKSGISSIFLFLWSYYMIHKGYRNSHGLIQACTQSFKFRPSSWWNGSPTGSTLRSNPEAWFSTVRWVLNISTSRNVQRAIRVRGFGSTRIKKRQACTNVRWSSQSLQWPWNSRLMHKALIPNNLIPSTQYTTKEIFDAHHSLHNGHNT